MRLQSLLARMPGSRTATRLVQRTWQQIVPSSPTIPAADRSASIDNLREIFRTIGIDKDYSGMSFDGLRTDVTGWGSTHRIFQRVLSQARPGLVIEVGSWKGASVIHIAQRCRELGLATRFICVDTWLGSNDTLWIDPVLRRELNLRHGYPTMFPQFVFNLMQTGHLDDVFPLPMTSTASARLLRRLEMMADAIYIDVGHEKDEVTIDIDLYYDLLRPGGVMFGDDYADDWPGVCQAVDEACVRRDLKLEIDTGKWLLCKPQDERSSSPDVTWG